MSPKSDSITKEQISSVIDSDIHDNVTVQETDSEALIAKIPHGYQCDYQLRIEELLSEIKFLTTTGRQLRKSRKGRDNP